MKCGKKATIRIHWKKNKNNLFYILMNSLCNNIFIDWYKFINAIELIIERGGTNDTLWIFDELKKIEYDQLRRV